jgi:sulfate adenylyltransferase subunit 1 (EFTu-like GTPase family)
VSVKSVGKFLQKGVAAAQFEESVGICLKGRHRIRRGQILSGGQSFKTSDRIRANIFWMDQTVHRMGEPLLFRCVTQEISCRIEEMYKKFDSASLEWVEEDASSIKGVEVADVMIHLKAQVVFDSFNHIPEMKRFVPEKEGRPVAGGIIL